MKIKNQLFLVAILLISLTAVNCGNQKDKKTDASIKDEQVQKTKTRSSKLEKWKTIKEKILSGVNGTSSILLSDGKIRCYFTKEGYIEYAESIDGNSFKQTVRTNIGIDDIQRAEEVPRNPSILRLKSGRYMMLYNTGIMKSGKEDSDYGEKLNLAYSDDGLSFEILGAVADLSKDKNAVTSGADSLLLPDGSIRVYGSQGGISTAVSKDGGKTWIADGVDLIEEGAGDPDVHIRDDGMFVMYYTMSEKEKSYIKMALSKDGMKWDLIDGNVIFEEEDYSLGSPDYLNIGGKKEIMYYTQTKEDGNKVSYNVKMSIRQ